jgi:catechol 2,3-dioxygenase-like lactoylglutathione lyase family enzyme
MLRIEAVDTVGMTVSDLDRSVAFYTNVLTFQKVADEELSGRPFELQSGVFGAHARRVTLRLGNERLQLTEYLAPRGRPIPDDVRPNDASFQHVAIIVSDMAAAYVRLRAAGVRHASTAPQRLPDWNPNAGGIRAFYFRDPDGHFLEVLQFPPEKGLDVWHRREPLFLGIDHTAIVSGDTERSLSLYRDRLGMHVAGESDNYDIEQEYLNGVFGARLRITTLRAASGPGIELLEYLAPRSGRPPSVDVAANDIVHWQTTLASPGIASLPALARAHVLTLVSPFAVTVEPSSRPSMLTRDPDGHGLLFVERDSMSPSMQSGRN